MMNNALQRTLVDIPLEDRERISPLKKLTTAVSMESPELFRTYGVPCIDRGPDGLRPPLPFEHWTGRSAGCYYSGANDAAAERLKRNKNFARPSAISSDAPSIFKIPGVAITRSNTITGLGTLCSPPPKHLPFQLPATYMHGRDAKPRENPIMKSGQWREIDPEDCKQGHGRNHHSEAASIRLTVRDDTTHGENSKKLQSSDILGGSSCLGPPASNGCGSEQRGLELVAARTLPVTPAPTRTRDSRRATDHSLVQGNDFRTSPLEEKTQEEERVQMKIMKPVPQESHGGSGSDKSRRRISAAKAFLSRLEGNRAPERETECIALFKGILQNCPTNNSAQMRDDVKSPTQYREARKNAAAAAAGAISSHTWRRNSLNIVAGLMTEVQGSYMLGPEKDKLKVSVGRDHVAK